jgi:glycosyltransferase involved in cell wall biosynthesis
MAGVPQPAQVSIIVAVLNDAPALQRCIDSITDQDYPNKQLVIVDGGSTDGSLEIIRDNAGSFAHWESEPDRGIYHAWNKAIERATGEWICFLGADDYFLDSSSLSDLVDRGELEGSDLVCGLVWYVDGQGVPQFTHGRPWDWKRMLRFHSVSHTGMLHRRRLFEEHGNFNEEFRIAGDYEFLLRLGPSLRASFVDRVYLCMSDSGVSSAKPVDTLKEARLIQQRHPEIGPLAAWRNYARCVSVQTYWKARRAVDGAAATSTLKILKKKIRLGR